MGWAARDPRHIHGRAIWGGRRFTLSRRPPFLRLAPPRLLQLQQYGIEALEKVLSGSVQNQDDQNPNRDDCPKFRAHRHAPCCLSASYTAGAAVQTDTSNCPNA